MVSKYYYLMALAKSVPVDTFDQFVAYARAHPGDILYGTVGAGSTQELVAHELEKIAGIKMTKVPFKGSTEITQEMLAGRIHFQVGPSIAIAPYYKTGELKVVATTSPERLKGFPEVPTLTERGYALTPYGWLGVCAGAGTPKPIVDLLNRHITSITQSDEYRQFLEKTGNIPAATTPEEFGRVFAQTVARPRPTSANSTCKSNSQTMKHSSDRILTTHAGSLPRPPDLLALVERDGPKAFDSAAAAAQLRGAVADIVRHQADLGIDVIDDGEYGKPSFVSYINERLGGYEIDRKAGPRNQWATSREGLSFPEFYSQTHAASTPHPHGLHGPDHLQGPRPAPARYR